jgi:flagellar hook-length control protein FliK
MMDMLNNATQTARLQSVTSEPSQKKDGDELAAGFEAALALMNMANPVSPEEASANQSVAGSDVMLNAQAKGLAQDSGKNPVAGQMSPESMAVMKELAAKTSVAEKAKLVQEGAAGKMSVGALSNMKTAAGMNTAATITGPNPWNKDWVFAGNDNAGVETLFGAKPDRALSAEQLVQAGAGQVSMQGSAALKAGKPDEILRQTGGMERVADPRIPSELGKKLKDAASVEDQESKGMAQLSGAMNAKAADDIATLAAGMNGAVEAVDLSAYAGEKPIRNLDSGKKAAVAAMKAAPVTAASTMTGAEFLETLKGARQAQATPVGSIESSVGEPRLKLVKGGVKEEQLVKADGPESFASKLSAIGAGAAPATTIAASGENTPVVAREVSGHVVQGSMAQDRLASASLVNIGTSVRDLNAQGGGEIRIRLKPETLGEIHLRVVTNGDHVGLQIRASDEKAKAILEHSMAELKDSLASQRLSLGMVEVSVANGAESFSGSAGDQSGQRNDLMQGHNQGGSYDGLTRQDRGDHGEGRFGGREAESHNPAVSVARAPKGVAAASAGASRASGRLDVMV